MKNLFVMLTIAIVFAACHKEKPTAAPVAKTTTPFEGVWELDKTSYPPGVNWYPAGFTPAWQFTFTDTYCYADGVEDLGNYWCVNDTIVLPDLSADDTVKAGFEFIHADTIIMWFESGMGWRIFRVN